jgi:hypothetical protein
MSQEAVERLLGRILTDDTFRGRAEQSLVGVCREAGFELTASELSVISRDDMLRLDMVSMRLDRSIKRVSY